MQLTSETFIGRSAVGLDVGFSSDSAGAGRRQAEFWLMFWFLDELIPAIQYMLISYLCLQILTLF